MAKAYSRWLRSRLEELQTHHCSHTGKLLRAAEIGVGDGRNAAYLLTSLTSLHLTMIDPWKSLPEYIPAGDSDTVYNQRWFDGQFQNAMAATEFAKDRRQVFRMPSLNASRLIADSSLHLVFLDDGTSVADVYGDINIWWPKVTPGGVLCGRYHGEAEVALQVWCSENKHPRFTTKASVGLWRMEKHL